MLKNRQVGESGQALVLMSKNELALIATKIKRPLKPCSEAEAALRAATLVDPTLRPSVQVDQRRRFHDLMLDHIADISAGRGANALSAATVFDPAFSRH